jgi:hypothetical protein
MIMLKRAASWTQTEFARALKFCSITDIVLNTSTNELNHADVSLCCAILGASPIPTKRVLQTI